MSKRALYNPDNWLVYLRMPDTALLKLAEESRYKSTGKGGQKKNKTENAVRLTLGDLLVTESGTRSQATNRLGALKKLRLAIALDLTKGSEFRTLMSSPPEEIVPYLGTAELRINPKNPVYSIYIGYLMDRYGAHFGELVPLAKELGYSRTQLTRFIERTPSLIGKLGELAGYIETLRFLKGSVPVEPEQ